ncbi:MAG: serine/threonine dehydratase [Mesorhizobium amorphae]|nr:MAG: serine/threonine dehydratase [Mesorhizobium amorphae]
MTPSLAHLCRAYAETRRATQLTPLLRSPALAGLSGAAQAFAKAENLQWSGSFKVRGALWRLSLLSEDERKRGAVAYSSGNFAQGLAAAGQKLGIPVTLVMPVDAPAAKRDATAGFGARVVLSEHGDRPREEVASERARAIAAEENLVLLHPFDDPEIVAGQAGVGLEALDQLEALGARADLVFCPAGGGGLIGGVSLAFHHRSPQTRVIGVEPERFDGMGRSLQAGEPITVPLGEPSICDGLMARRPGVHTFPVSRATGVEPATVSDAAVRRAMKLAFERLKLVLEPSGAASLAALLEGPFDIAGKSVLVVLSGGNVSFSDFARHISDA